MQYMFLQLSVDSKLFMGYVIGASSIKRVLETRPRKSLIAQAKSLPSALEVQLYFHALIFLGEYMLTKLVSTVRICNRDIRLGCAVLVALKAWDACTRNVGQKSMHIVLLY